MTIEENTPHAVFVVCEVTPGIFAATTRPFSKTRIGLPGGKLESGEPPLIALFRECNEEGWNINDVEAEPFMKNFIEGNEIWWYTCTSADPLDNYKEIGRVDPIFATMDEVIESGFGNDAAMIVYKGLKNAIV